MNLLPSSRVLLNFIHAHSMYRQRHKFSEQILSTESASTVHCRVTARRVNLEYNIIKTEVSTFSSTTNLRRFGRRRHKSEG